MVDPETNNEPETNNSSVAKVLRSAEEDLAGANFPWIIGKLFNPVREYVLLPIAGKANEIVPDVTHAIPFGDQIFSFAFGTTFSAIKLGYSLLPHQRDMEQRANFDTELELQSVQNKINKYEELQRLPNDIISSLLSVFGFMANMTIDILTSPFNGKLQQWGEIIVTLIAYLVFTGIQKDLEKAFFNPRAIDNGIIIARIENSGEIAESTAKRRHKTALAPLPIGLDQFSAIMKDATIYCRFATAAYGVSMIESANVLQVHNKPIIQCPRVESASKLYRERTISKYCLAKDTTNPKNTKDILYITPVGGDIKLLGHFVAVDHRHKSVVLAIRGTYSASELLIDVDGYTTPFCDGVAHKGIAERASILWENPKTRAALEKAFRENPNYELVITGHSLGAGAACLLTIKLYYERPNWVPKNIRCFAFAPPPVYKAKIHVDNSINANVTLAMENIVAFIHEHDCVPFLSAASIRRLANTFSEVDEQTKGRYLERKLLAAGVTQPSTKLVEIVESSLPPEPVLGADAVAIPTRFVIWMLQSQKNPNADTNNNGGNSDIKYNAMLCRPQHAQGEGGGNTALNDLSILLNKRMLSDHMMPNYERGINSIRAQILRNQPGYLVVPHD